MQQTDENSAAAYRERIARLQDAMKEFGLQAVVLEPGPAMTYLTGVRWGKSEHTFVVVLPAKGEPVWVLPGFEEMRARELIHLGHDDIRVWQEDESPYALVAQGLKDRGAGAQQVLKAAGVDTAQQPGRGRGR
ncbi:MAG TPA: aminopeptidase P family N-terminal domain-containing protein [Bryobacteraceae bacterium]|nr:aminopeptidase P family N-terminal domain-containing protein [Bryobacteraceae bacterium]